MIDVIYRRCTIDFERRGDRKNERERNKDRILRKFPRRQIQVARLRGDLIDPRSRVLHSSLIYSVGRIIARIISDCTIGKGEKREKNAITDVIISEIVTVIA